MPPDIQGFYDPTTATVSYVVTDPASRHAAIIDPLLDYEPRAGRISHDSAERIAEHVAAAGLSLDWILETHPHADHLSAGALLKARLGGTLAIGAGVKTVQQTWKAIYNLDAELPADGSQFDHLFADGERFRIGELEAEAWHTPGHTPACVCYLIGDAVFVGDTLFMPDFGTARADFPGGDARVLYKSIRRILSLPPETRLFTCHDYRPGGRAVAWETTVGEQRKANKHVRDGVDEAAFVAMRSERDKDLNAPDLLLPAVQVNLRGGQLPEPEANGIAYLKIPLNRF